MIPSHFKESLGYILRIPRKEDYIIPKAYRCIALENTFSKIIEHTIKNRLWKVALEKGLIHQYQMGGIPQRGTSDAVTFLSTMVQTAIEKKDKAMAIFLDVKGAFDAIDHKHLQTILRDNNVPSYLEQTIISFLMDRIIRVTNGINKSKPYKLQIGTPQGSPLSPLLFNIYSAPLIKELNKRVVVISYMDDIMIFLRDKSWPKLYTLGQEILNKTHQLSKSIKLHFSEEKSEALVFRPKGVQPNTFYAKNKQHLRLGTSSILFRKHLTWLGVVITQTLAQEEHLKMRLQRAKIALGPYLTNLGHIKIGTARRIIMQAIFPNLFYGIELLPKHPIKTTIDGQIEKFINKMIRSTLRLPRDTPTAPMRLELEVPDRKTYTSIRQIQTYRRYVQLPPTHPTKIVVNYVKKHIRNFTPSNAVTEGEYQMFKTLQQDSQYKEASIKLIYDNKPNFQLTQNLIWVEPLNLPSEKEVGKEYRDNLKYENYIQQKEQILNITIEAFSDGSKDTKTGQTAWSSIIYSEGAEIASESERILPIHSIDEAEILGIYNSFKQIQHITESILPGISGNVIINCDNTSALAEFYQPENVQKNILAQKAHEIMRNLPNCNFYLMWSPGHCGIKGNECADKKAKQAVTNPVTNNTIYLTKTTITETQKMVHRNHLFKKYLSADKEYRDRTVHWHNRERNWTWNHKRKEIQPIIRLRTGAMMVGAPELRGRTKKQCQSCDTIQTIQHATEECIAFRKARKKYLDIENTSFTLKSVMEEFRQETITFIREIEKANWYVP